MSSGKKIAVIIRDRQAEALRMALGLTILNDVDIYILDKKIEESDEILLNLDMIKEMKLKVYSNNQLNKGFDFVSTEEIAKRLLQYDNILPY